MKNVSNWWRHHAIPALLNSFHGYMMIVSLSLLYHSSPYKVTHIFLVIQVSQAGIINCIPHNIVGCNYSSLPEIHAEVLNLNLEAAIVIAFQLYTIYIFLKCISVSANECVISIWKYCSQNVSHFVPAWCVKADCRDPLHLCDLYSKCVYK